MYALMTGLPVSGSVAKFSPTDVTANCLKRVPAAPPMRALRGSFERDPLPGGGYSGPNERAFMAPCRTRPQVVRAPVHSGVYPKQTVDLPATHLKQRTYGSLINDSARAWSTRSRRPP